MNLFKSNNIYTYIVMYLYTYRYITVIMIQTRIGVKRIFDTRPIPEYQNEAVRKYIKEKRDTMQVYLPKGYKDEIKKHAKKYQQEEGEPGKAGYTPKGSVTAFVNRAIREAIERDIQDSMKPPEHSKNTPAGGKRKRASHKASPKS